jgi:hypothetical protein
MTHMQCKQEQPDCTGSHSLVFARLHPTVQILLPGHIKLSGNCAALSAHEPPASPTALGTAQGIAQVAGPCTLT